MSFNALLPSFRLSRARQNDCIWYDRGDRFGDSRIEWRNFDQNTRAFHRSLYKRPNAGAGSKDLLCEMWRVLVYFINPLISMNSNAGTYYIGCVPAWRAVSTWSLWFLIPRLDNSSHLEEFPTMELVWWFVQSSQESKLGTISTVFYVSFFKICHCRIQISDTNVYTSGSVPKLLHQG